MSSKLNPLFFTFGDVMAKLTDPTEPCMLGAAAILYMQVVAQWHSGQFAGGTSSLVLPCQATRGMSCKVSQNVDRFIDVH